MDVQERSAFLARGLTEYQQLWSKFMDMFTAGTDKEESDIGDEEEQEFRELQAELIRRTQSLGHRMPSGVFHVKEDVYNLFVQSISLRIIHSEPSIKITDLRNQWHEVSISLNQMHGQLRSALEERVSHKKKGKKKRH